MREYQLMKKAIDKFDLDLHGKVVFTEAASDCFLWTPIIAALSGADHVFAVTAPSRYASVAEVVENTTLHAEKLGVLDRIELCTSKDLAHIAQADIITNLGFVRPIDASFIHHLKKDAVISLMWEPWEFRPEDIDLGACMKRKIALLGTNEHDERLQTFRYVAMTVVKLLLENQIEIFDTDILILGGSHFLPETQAMLESLGARVACHLEDCDEAPDCIICLEHKKNDCLIGLGGRIDLQSIDSSPLVIHVCGQVEVSHVKELGSLMVPEQPAACGSMSFTTGYAGPKPVIDLHTAGLKVGQAWLDKDSAALRALALPLPQYHLEDFPGDPTSVART